MELHWGCRDGSKFGHVLLSDCERKLILSERSYDPAQRANDKQTPLLPLVCDIIKTPAVWSVEQIDQLHITYECLRMVSHLWNTHPNVCRVNMVGDFANNFGSYVLLSEVADHFMSFGYDVLTEVDRLISWDQDVLNERGTVDHFMAFDHFVQPEVVLS